MRHPLSDLSIFSHCESIGYKIISRHPAIQDFFGSTRHPGNVSAKTNIADCRLSNSAWFVFLLYVYSIQWIFCFAMRIVYRLFRQNGDSFCRYAQKTATWRQKLSFSSKFRHICSALLLLLFRPCPSASALPLLPLLKAMRGDAQPCQKKKQAHPFADSPALTHRLYSSSRKAHKRVFTHHRVMPVVTFHQNSGSFFSEVQSA